MRKRHFPRLFVLFLIIVLCVLSACSAPAPAFDTNTAQKESSVTASADDMATAIIQQTPIDHMVALESKTISRTMILTCPLWTIMPYI